VEPGGGVVAGDQGGEGLAVVALADQHRLEAGLALLERDQRLDQDVVALHRDEPAGGDDEGVLGLRGGAGREDGVDPGGDDVDPVGPVAELVDQLVLGRPRQRDDPRPPVEERGDPALDGVAHGGEPRREHHLPHLGVDVVQEDDPRPDRPQRREEGHPVPDLDEAVPSSVAVDDLVDRSPGKDQVAATLPDDLVPVAPAERWVPLRVGGPQQHLDARLRPQLGDGGGVHLRAARLDVVEVAPRDEVDPPEAGAGGDVAQLGDLLGAIDDGHAGWLGVTGHALGLDGSVSGRPVFARRRGGRVS
jgi:hypothetical protein